MTALIALVMIAFTAPALAGPSDLVVDHAYTLAADIPSADLEAAAVAASTTLAERLCPKAYDPVSAYFYDLEHNAIFPPSGGAAAGDDLAAKGKSCGGKGKGGGGKKIDGDTLSCDETG